MGNKRKIEVIVDEKGISDKETTEYVKATPVETLELVTSAFGKNDFARAKQNIIDDILADSYILEGGGMRDLPGDAFCVIGDAKLGHELCRNQYKYAAKVQLYKLEQ